MAYEEANYEVVKQNKIYEIRKYSDRLAIETITSNQGSSFRKLFNYIIKLKIKINKPQMDTKVIVGATVAGAVGYFGAKMGAGLDDTSSMGAGLGLALLAGGAL